MPTRKMAKGKTKVKRRKTPVAKATTRRKTATRKKRAKKTLGSALITQESHADRERRDQIEAGQSASTAGSSQTDTQTARAIRSAGGAYRCRDPLLQSPVSRDPTARVRCAARWRCDPHPRTHDRFQPEG